MPLGSWSFLTNHFLVLAQIHHRPDTTGREIADAVGITERTVRDILADLRTAGYIELERVGRRNRYRVNSGQLLALQGDRAAIPIGELLGLLGS